MPMDRIPPKRIPLRPDGAPMSAEEIRELRDRIAAFDDITWIDDDTREIVEMFMPDLVSRGPVHVPPGGEILMPAP
jgi:hypothetical protein